MTDPARWASGDHRQREIVRANESFASAFSKGLNSRTSRNCRHRTINHSSSCSRSSWRDSSQLGGLLDRYSRRSAASVNRTTPITLTQFQRQAAKPLSDGTGVATTAATAASRSRRLRVARLLACLFGLLAGLALALVLERFDTRLRSSRRAEEAFGLPVLAEVPAISRRRRARARNGVPSILACGGRVPVRAAATREYGWDAVTTPLRRRREMAGTSARTGRPNASSARLLERSRVSNRSSTSASADPCEEPEQAGEDHAQRETLRDLEAAVARRRRVLGVREVAWPPDAGTPSARSASSG